MRIKEGGNRFAILLPELGIVIKFPIIKWSGLINYIKNSKRRGGLIKRTIYELREYNYRVYWSIQWILAKGFIDNWKEFVFYRRHKLEICEPTWFSLLGIFNIQRYGAPLPEDISEHELLVLVYELTDGKSFNASHTFTEGLHNYSQTDGGLTIFDYASPDAQTILIEYGDYLKQEIQISLLTRN